MIHKKMDKGCVRRCWTLCVENDVSKENVRFYNLKNPFQVRAYKKLH